MTIPTREQNTTQHPTPNGRNLSRIHIQKRIDEQGVTINIFADTPDDALALLDRTVVLCEVLERPAPLPAGLRPDNQAARELINAQRKAAQLGQTPSAQPRSNKGLSNAPSCAACGLQADVQLIQWQDKETGAPMRRWKCQTCNKWLK